LIELLVVIAIVGILAALILPALSRTKSRAQGVLCLNNGKQMMAAVLMYTSDNNNFFPPNPDDGNKVAGHNWCGGQAGRGGQDEFNADVLRDPDRNVLVPYLSKVTSPFRCPTDKRWGTYQGSDPALAGRQVPSARTFAMNQAVGTICAQFDAGPSNQGGHSGIPNLSVNGPWLNNQFDHRRNSPWRTYGKASDIGPPGPSMLWVLVDEDASGLNDAAFAFGMESPAWFDFPGSYHDAGCGFAFADGHSETHRWQAKVTAYEQAQRITDPGGINDWLWMRQRTSAHVSGNIPEPK
jgi:prepilin-type processing-associated H-X9-DG protein